MNRRRPLVPRAASSAIAALSLTLLIAACGNNNGSDGPSTTTAGTAAPSATDPSSTTSNEQTETSAPNVAESVEPVATLAPKDIRLSLTTIAEIEFPTAVAARVGDTAMYVASQPGKVFAVRAGTEPVLALDIADDVKSGGEQGLIGLTFSPDGNTAFINYTRSDDSIQVEAMPVLPDGAIDKTARRVVINIPHPGEQNHNGGNLMFGPDGMLYIGVGDGGGSGDPERHGQDLLSLLGKILRIDPLAPGADGYDLPEDNPFFAMSSKRNEIWAYGLRNPWRFSFDRLTGDLWIGDVGQNKYEEIDVAWARDGGGKGANFGWSAYEATHRFNKDQKAPDHIEPVYEYPHNKNSASVTGGFVYRGEMIPGLYGAYLFADEVSGTLWALRLSDKGKAIVAKVGSINTVSSFGEDLDGELYALSYGDGKVLRIVAGP